MREIKFRAWDTFLNEWQDQAETGDFDFVDGLEVDYDEDRFIAEQYTGLKDKNNKEIYEGDIINFMFLHEPLIRKNGFVEFKHGAFRIIYGKHAVGFGKTIEIIGNIHKNPELLKQS